MRLDEAIDSIESSDTVIALREVLQRIAEDYGFGSFGFVDIGVPGVDNPFWLATSDMRWIEDYRSNKFLESDPIIPVVRRTNTPFRWSDVSPAVRKGKRKPIAMKIMEAAFDYGMSDGLVIPFHFVDKMGRINSASCAFHWKSRIQDFKRIPREYRTSLHIVMIYWAQKVMDLAGDEARRDRQPLTGADAKSISLTDRERSVLEWAARGKTVAETATILSISSDTIETYVRNAMRKLNAVNKLQAAVKAIKLGIIDV